MTTPTRMAYYVDYPRDFANEYTVYAVSEGLREEFRGAYPNAQRITRREAIRLGWTRPREARRDGEQWFGGFAETRGAYRLDEALTQCAEATASLVAEAT